MRKDKLPPEALEFFKKQGSIGGKLGGSKAWKDLSTEERSARAKHAVDAREAKRAARPAASKETPKRKSTGRGKP